jgi:translation initiation factor 1
MTGLSHYPPMAPKDPSSRIVYSTGSGRICPGCRRPSAQCACRGRGSGAGSAAASAGAAVRVGRATQGRAGKGVTVITGLPLPPPELEALSAELKRHCGSGGTIREGTIEIQGEHRDRIVQELTRRGFAPKRSGG